MTENPSAGKFGYYSPWRKKPINLTLQDHAILSADGEVLFIRRYERDWNPKSKTIVPIPDHLPVKPGWWYHKGKFQKEPPQ